LRAWAIVGRLRTQACWAIGWTLAKIWFRLPVGAADLVGVFGAALDGVRGFGSGSSDMENPYDQRSTDQSTVILGLRLLLRGQR
jgi:hypothetical protein